MKSVKRYERGYSSAMSDALKSEFRQKFQRRSMGLGIFLTLSVQMSIYASLYVAYEAIGGRDWASVLILCGCLLFVARQMRYLENVVHFGSHNNLSSGRWNDLFVNWAAAYAVMQEIDGYRLFHRTHHAYFGADADPCRKRFSQFDQYQRGFKGPFELAGFIARNFPQYAFAYYREIGSSPRTLLLFGVWHAFVLTSLSLLISPMFCLFASGLLLGVFFVILPAVRFVAEVSEHDYVSDDSEYGCTFNNLSMLDKLLFHPGGDAYHVVHHLYPTVPWWAQAQAHRFLFENDFNYRIALHRTDFLQPVAPRLATEEAA